MPDPGYPGNPDPQSGARQDAAGAALVIGCGYLGRRVAQAWLHQGRRVFATTRGRADELRALGVEPIIADACNPATLNNLPAVASVVYCVGLDSSSGASLSEIYVN